jgi:hypothetical protein
MGLRAAGLVLMAACFATCAHGQSQGASPGSPMNGDHGGPDATRVQQELAAAEAAEGPLKMTFDKKSAEWTPATLAPLKHTTITVFNEHEKINQTFSGVPLIDLLKQLGVPDKPRGKEFRLYLVAEGSDGYQVVYSLGEVTPDVHDATIIVADSLEGKPLAGTGPLQLVATGEKRPARWVRNLVAIRVLTAQ